MIDDRQSPQASELALCRYCEGTVTTSAKKCRHCGEWLVDPTSARERVSLPEPPVRSTPTVLLDEVSRYVDAGYAVTSRTPESVILTERRRFNWWLFLLWMLLGLLPAVLYVLYYATKRLRTVELRQDDDGGIRVLGAALPPPHVAPPLLTTRPNDTVFALIGGVAVLMLCVLWLVRLAAGA